MLGVTSIVIVLLQPGYGVLCEMFFSVKRAADANPTPHGPPRTSRGLVIVLQAEYVNRFTSVGLKQMPGVFAGTWLLIDMRGMGASCAHFLFSSAKVIVYVWPATVSYGGTKESAPLVASNAPCMLVVVTAPEML
jgi:hypothetical protein